MAIKNKIREAFTLAEVLITLTVIGIIAAITIPAVIQNIQDMQLRVAWKEAYQMLDQATKRVMIDNGGTMKGLCNDGDNWCLMYWYLPHLMYLKTNGMFTPVWADDAKEMDGSPADPLIAWYASAALNNGMFIAFTNTTSKNCNSGGWGLNKCGQIMVDVNGYKKPNIIGKDIFGVNVLENRIVPIGALDNLKDTCEGYTGNNAGYGCSAKYLKE